MAEIKSAWGIDIGQAGLKAIRLRSTEDGRRVVATAFDYIPHAKILSQPDAVPEELIRTAITTFLGRNQVDGDLIGISVPGQSSLAKFIKLPPVEAGKVAEIVRYEARQQIPFDLNEVIWDYQPIGGSPEESGFMLEAEVGLFAMKRDLVFDAMKPLTSNRKEIELVQIAPLAIYNYLSFDVLGFRKTAETPDPPSSEDYYVMLDMGADNTTLLVSNGRSIWIRNVPIGGNHFTRALTREMKLTFAKAEHLKLNATKSPDPKAVFQAMRPVFNDFVTEVQRSIGYFGSVNRAAKIRKIIGVGNGFRLAGLQKFLQQNLQYEVQRLESLEGVTGDSVLTDPVFMENIMTFAVPYGVALQTLGQTRITTSLLPPEIVVNRKIRSKKPWAVASAAGLMLALGLGVTGSATVLDAYSESRWKTAQDAVKTLQSTISANQAAYTAQQTDHKKVIDDIGQLVAPLEKRVLWMELLKAVNECLPRDEGNEQDQEDLSLQKKIRVQSVTSRKVADVGTWFTALKTADPECFLHLADPEKGPTGKGYIVTLRGYHLYNSPTVPFEKRGGNFLLETVVSELAKWTVNRNGVEVPVGKLGISHPVSFVVAQDSFTYDPNARIGQTMTGIGPGAGGFRNAGPANNMLAGGGGNGGLLGNRRGGDDEDEETSAGPAGNYGANVPVLPGMNNRKDVQFEEAEAKELKVLEKTHFVLQFAWVPTLERARLDVSPNVPKADAAGATPDAAKKP
ncbi:MAG: pilus assembly protein PilM [Planctomyces sp.]